LNGKSDDDGKLYLPFGTPIAYRRTTPNISPLTAHRHNLGYGRATEIQPNHQTDNIALLYFG